MRPQGTAIDTSRPLDYMPQLDSLRTIAVMSVFLFHFLPPENAFRRLIPWGDLGVRLFFVLSGFLITGILLSCRAKIERDGMHPLRGIRNFYARRFLRLFPLYYLYVGAGLLMLPAARQYSEYFLFYAQNFLFALHREAVGTMTHLWSLAVEEQFYLTWPWLVIFAPQRRLVPVLGAIVLLGPVFRITGQLAGQNDLAISMMMPAHFDTLGMGGLLAVLADRGPALALRQLMRLGLWLGGALLVVTATCEHFQVAVKPTFVVAEMSAGLFFCWVIGRAARGFGGWAGSVLNASVLVYLGGISYGLYVVHFHVPGLLRDKILPRLGLSLPDSDALNLAVFTLISIVLAMVSWHWMEAPINRLKRHFPYSARPAPAAAVSPPVTGGKAVAPIPVHVPAPKHSL